MTKVQAEYYVSHYEIEIDRNWYTLSSFQVGKVLEAADEHKYKVPWNANGSTARYFFSFLKRALKKKD